MPALNEGTLVQQTIDDCYKIKKYTIQVLVVIDSGITKSTLDAAKKTKARIINIGKGKGKGTAVRKAIPFCRGDIIVQLDADYQFLPSDLPKIVDPLLRGSDVTLGTRYQKGSHVEKNSVTTLKFLGSLFLSAVTSVFAKQRVTDVMAGYKGFTKNALINIDPQVDHFGYEAEMVLKAAYLKYKIVNVPISYRKRDVGNSNVHSIKHGMLVLQTILHIGKQNLLLGW